MGFRDSVENNPVMWLLAALATGFGSGFGAYEVILRTSQADVVRRGTYVAQREFDSLAAKYQTASRSLDSARNALKTSRAAGPSKPTQQTFPEPTIDGIRLDACYESNTRCGDEPANEWCRSKGFNRAVAHKGENVGSKNIPTKQIGSHAVCNAVYCASFLYITCEK